jgi:hypothetical protein
MRGTYREPPVMSTFLPLRAYGILQLIGVEQKQLVIV